MSDIIAAGMLPAALEMMDRLSAQASEAAVHPNYPVCEALLLVELDGAEAEVKAQMVEATVLCRQNGAWEVRLALTANERGLIWKGRKAAFAAMGRISPNYIVQDGVIPRTALPVVLEEITRMAAEVQLRVANVFHAGDGNLHPMVLYDQSISGQEEIAASCRTASFICASIMVVPSRVSMAWAKRSSRRWATCSANLISIRCSLFDRPSIRRTSLIQTSSFPGRGCVARSLGHTRRTRWRTAGVAEFF